MCDGVVQTKVIDPIPADRNPVRVNSFCLLEEVRHWVDDNRACLNFRLDLFYLDQQFLTRIEGQDTDLINEVKLPDALN